MTESVTEDSAEKSPVGRNQPFKGTRKGLKKYKSVVRKLRSRVNDKTIYPKVVKSKAAAVVMSLEKVSHPNEDGKWDGATHGGREKENRVPPMLLAGLMFTASKARENERTLADTRLEMEVVSQCGSGGLEDYKPSRTNLATMKLEGQLDVVEYSCITVTEPIHMGNPAGGYVEVLNVKISAREHLMAWHDKQAMHEYLMELMMWSNLNRKEYGTVMSSGANKDGLELLVKIFWKTAL